MLVSRARTNFENISVNRRQIQMKKCRITVMKTARHDEFRPVSFYIAALGEDAE